MSSEVTLELDGYALRWEDLNEDITVPRGRGRAFPASAGNDLMSVPSATAGLPSRM